MAIWVSDGADACIGVQWIWMNFPARMPEVMPCISLRAGSATCPANLLASPIKPDWPEHASLASTRAPQIGIVVTFRSIGLEQFIDVGRLQLTAFLLDHIYPEFHIRQELQVLDGLRPETF